MDLADHLRDAADVREDPADDQHQMRRHEQEEQGQEDRHGLLDASNVEHHEDEDRRELEGELERLIANRDEREHSLAPARDGDRNRQDVVHDQSRAGENSGGVAEELGRHGVAAAAEREQLDDLRVRVGDDEDRERRRRREQDGEVGVLAESTERLVRAVRRGREPVGAQTDPGEERPERDAVEESGVAEGEWPPEQQPLQALASGRRVGRRRRSIRRPRGGP